MGFIPEDQINRVKDSVDIIDLISSYIELRPAGANHKGRCPFHHEKTPSFMVSPQRNSYKCFGCGEGGDAISFIMKIENLDYIGAIRFLADKLGIILDETEFNKEANERRERLYKINGLTARYYLRNMLIEEQPQAYITKRGFDIKVVNAFYLGYAKNDNGLLNFLLQEKVDVEDMLALGLVGKSQNQGIYYDKFRDRLMFPILNNKQKVIGFGGRTIVDNKIKYLNSPESDVFHKGDNLYGVDKLQKRVNRDKIILVEGYMDVIGLYNCGIDYATASLGTALTENQAKLVKRYGKSVYIAYDSDEAGIKATLRAISIFHKLDVEPRIVEFPESMDPDDYIKAKGVDSFNKLLHAAKSALDFKMDLEIAKGGDKISLTERMINFLSEIDGHAKREIYAQKIAKAIDVSFDSLMVDVGKKIDEKSKDSKNSLDNRGFNANYGYHSDQRVDTLKTQVKLLSSDQLKLKLEKELLSKSLINKDFYILLKEKTKEFVESKHLIDLYEIIEKHFDNKHEQNMDYIFSSQVYERAGISVLVDAQISRFREGTEKSVSEELLNRIERFQLQTRLEELFALLKKDDMSVDEKIKLTRELVDIQGRLTQ